MERSKNKTAFFLILLPSLFVLLIILIIANKDKVISKREQGYSHLLGISLTNSTFPRNADLIHRIHSNQSENPEVNIIIREARDSSEQQIKDINELLSYGIDLLIISPLDDEAVYARLKTLSIPVILLDAKPIEDISVAKLEYDNYNAGKLLAEQVNQNPLSPKGILLLTGNEGDYVSDQRTEGFLQNLKPELHDVLTKLSANWNRNEAENRTKYYLVSGKEAGVVVGLNDQMAYGSYLGCKKLRETKTNFYGINGFDGEFAGLDLVNRKILTGTVSFEDKYHSLIHTALSVLKKKPYDKTVQLKAGYIRQTN